jgi:hypothetical protein
VVAPDGAPTACYVSAGNAGFRGDAQGSSTNSGNFRIGPLLPGRYQVSASHSGAARADSPPLTGSDPQTVDAGTEGVELRLKAGCDLEVSAIDAASGDPVPATFTLVPAERETAIYTGGFRDSAVLGGQPPGRYRVLARTEGGLVGSVQVEVAAGERRALTIPVNPGGSVRVAYGGPARVLTVGLEEGGARLGLVYVPSGNSESLYAPAGDYTLRLSVREYDHATQAMNTLHEETRAVQITVGSEASVEIER